MPSIGPAELIVVLIIALAVLGPKRLPEVGRGLGRSMREFKSCLDSTVDDARAIGADDRAVAVDSEREPT